MSDGTMIDWEREKRTGIPEVVFAEFKTDEALLGILLQTIERAQPLLFTRLLTEQYAYIAANTDAKLDYDPLSRTMIYGPCAHRSSTLSIGIVAAGTSDMPVAIEAQRSLRFFGVTSSVYADVGVAGLWRLTSIQAKLDQHAVLIAIAGMEGALFSVLAGLVNAPVIAVPSSVGYGVANGGNAALHSALASCSPGIVTVNIDNGFGAAAAARKFVRMAQANQ